MADSNIIVKIKTTNTDFTQAIKDYVEKKIHSLEKFLVHYGDESGELLFEVEIGKTTEHHKRGDVFRAEINFTAGGSNFRAVAVRDDLYAAIDEAKDEMQRELRRNKNRYIHLTRRGARDLKNFIKGITPW